MKIKAIWKFLTVTVLMLAASGCANNELVFMQKDFFTKEKGVTVASCPSNVYMIVNDYECVTPCKLDLPKDTEILKVEHGDNVGYVQVSRAGFHTADLQGTLMILNVDKIGVDSDAPDAPVFLRDSELGLSNFCGVTGNQVR